MKRRPLFFLIWICIYTSASLPVKAQNDVADSTDLQEDSLITISKSHNKESVRPKNFKRAILWASTLPGAGQIYNEKYWKLPMVYGGLGGITYWLVSGVKDFRCYRGAIRALNDDDPNNDIGCNGFTSSSALQLKRENSRRQIDYGVLLLSLGYALQIMDAAVDARLSHFHIDDHLLLSWTPVVVPNPLGPPILGLSVSLHLE